MKVALYILAGLIVGFILWVRVAKDDPVVWHIDPTDVVKGGKPNQYLLLPTGDKSKSPVFAISATELASAFDNMALAQPRVIRLAGNVDNLWITYVQRSGWMRFPDYISVKFIDNPDGTASLAIYSRSRFGRSDLGVNRARIKMWIKALGQTIVA